MKQIMCELALQVHKNSYSEAQVVNETMAERKRLSVFICACSFTNGGKPASVRATDTEIPPPGPPASGLALEYLTTTCHLRDVKLFWLSFPFLAGFFVIMCGFMMEN